MAFLVDDDGIVQEKYTYDAFGSPKLTALDGSAPRSASYYGHDFLFQGREYISELGIYDYRNRFYLPMLGRFLQTDPKGFDAGDMNLFRYCGDDPVSLSDPLGTGWYYPRYERTMLEIFRKAPLVYIAGGIGIGVMIWIEWHEHALQQLHNASRQPILKPAIYPSSGRRHPEIHAAPPGNHLKSSGPNDGAKPEDSGAEPEQFPSFDPTKAPPVRIVRPPRANLMYVGIVPSTPSAPSTQPILFGHRLGGRALYSSNGGSTWSPISGSSYDLRWARLSGTGNWQATETAKAIELAGGLCPNAGEGFHPVSFDKE